MSWNQASRVLHDTIDLYTRNAPPMDYLNLAMQAHLAAYTRLADSGEYDETELRNRRNILSRKIATANELIRQQGRDDLITNPFGSSNANAPAPANSSSGGSKRHPTRGAASKWVSSGRSVTLHDGSKRSLYKNAAKPGDLRIKRVATRDGARVASFVKPPK